ncbi:MAG: RidA family protein [Microscillaceae bacterium]|nr:RidA family protein [Microscillaceae bacterium]
MKDKKVIQSERAPSPIGPYSQAILVDRFLYVSGQIALNENGDLVTANIEAETHQVMHNLEAILMEAGMDFSNVVKCSIFVKDLNNFAAINEVYGSYFYETAPARETVEVSRLPKDVNVEISCIAFKAQRDYVS